MKIRFLISNTLVATVIPYETETYILTAYKNGCVLTDEVTVTVNNLLTIPGSFSPNGMVLMTNGLLKELKIIRIVWFGSMIDGDKKLQL